MIQEVLQKLQELQEILAQKYLLENELKEIPKALHTKNELLNRLKQSYVDKNERLEVGQKTIGELRIKMTDAEHEREEYEERMGSITTQREYEALIKEIRVASEKEQDFRKDLQKEERYLEELQKNIESDELLIAEQTKELQLEQQKIQDETKSRTKSLEELTQKEEAIIPGMDEEMVFKFRRIIRSKGGRGIVPLRSSVCSGCNMILPAQFVNDVRAETEIRFCPYCSMILYHQPELDEEDMVFDNSIFDDDEDFDDDFDDDFSEKLVEESDLMKDEFDEDGETDNEEDDHEDADDSDLDDDETEESLEEEHEEELEEE